MMNAPLRCGVFLVATSLAGGATLGCHRESHDSAQLLAEVVKAYEPLKSRAAELQTTLADIHKGADELAVAAPGGQEFRSKLLAADEVLGVADARTKWLSGELDEAAKTPGKKKEEIAALADQVTKTAADLGQVGAVSLELTHEKARLSRVAALLKAPYERDLPDGYRIKAASSGIEAGLIGAIQNPTKDPKKKPDKTSGWFDFDRLVFIGESADIDLPQSRSQLQNIVEILRAYPAVKLKIGGYVDSAGPAERARMLSTNRAEAVRTALIQMGVKPARLEAQGYGSQRPVCPANDTEFCRAQNRRISVLVTAIAR
jgi:outer membrane protein OmpA-like peptidoglycan-associated protein